MPRTAKGSTFVIDGAQYARVVVAPKKYVARSLLGIVALEDDTGARAWAGALQSLVTTLRALGRAGELTKQLDTALRVGREDNATGLARVMKSVAKLRASLDVHTLATEVAARPSSALTVRKFGERWTRGELHVDFPDHVPDKKSAHKDASNLENHVYPVVGHVPLREFTLKHAQEVMRRLPRELSTSTRRHVAQVMVRLCNLAVYPCEILPASPLPKGFLPKVKVRTGAHLYPAEDRALMACAGADDAEGVPLANRLLYGFLAREGMRKEEALSLTWDAVDLDTGTVTLDENKTDDPRAWALDPGVVRALARWKEGARPSDRVFQLEDPGHLPEALRAHLALAGVTRPQLFEHNAKRRRVNVHALRATFVTLALANGRSEAWVQDRTGHRSSAMVNRYKRSARTAAELGLGALAPLDVALPDLPREREGAGKVQGRAPIAGERTATIH